MDDRAERIGRNEVLFREINERLENVNAAFTALSKHAEFVCECGDAACLERISVPLAEYERLRHDPTQFALVRGHEDVDVESVVHSAGGYVVVRKHPGGPAELAASEDPRA